jgi:hypothetical protein
VTTSESRTRVSEVGGVSEPGRGVRARRGMSEPGGGCRSRAGVSEPGGGVGARRAVAAGRLLAGRIMAGRDFAVGKGRPECPAPPACRKLGVPLARAQYDKAPSIYGMEGALLDLPHRPSQSPSSPGSRADHQGQAPAPVTGFPVPAASRGCPFGGARFRR